MSEKELEIFALCERLTELLGDKEAIADLKKLYDRHPEMFKDMQEVSQTIKEVVSEPEIAVNANRNNKNYEVIKAAKILNDEKMADVVIKNENGTNEIFHANKKRIGEFYRLKKRENLLQVETPTPSTRQLNGLELIENNLSGANALSAIDKSIKNNEQMLVEASSAKAAPTRLSRYADKSSDLSRDSKVLSTSAKDIIPQSATSLENKTNLTEVSESAITKMKHKIDEVAKKGFGFNKESKNNSKDKGAGR